MSRSYRVATVALSAAALAVGSAIVMVLLAPTPASSLSGASHKAAPTAIPRAVAALVAPAPTAPPAPPASAVCAATAAGVKEIYVSISQQHLWACTGSVLWLDAAVTTGASALTNVHDATPVGLSHITKKVRNTVLRGSDVNGPWDDAVAYWMPFNGGDGFHDAPWQTFPLGSPLYTTQGSHGCVHVGPAVVMGLYNWAEVGTLVDVQA